MSIRANYTPKHRDVPERSVLATGARRTAMYSGVAAVATGVSVSSGMISVSGTAVSAAANDLEASASSIDSAASAASTDVAADRGNEVSRSAGDRRAQADAIKSVALSDPQGVSEVKVEKINSSDPQELAKALMPEYGLRTSEFGCLDRIWSQESGWNVHADNPHSSAYGIPQALPGSKMSSAGPDWANSAETQIRWGLGYIRDRYGSACGAWGFKSGHGWY